MAKKLQIDGSTEGVDTTVDADIDDVRPDYSDSDLYAAGELPTIFYRCPGPHSRNGGTFDTKPIKSIAEADAAMADGWFHNLPAAVEAYDGT